MYEKARDDYGGRFNDAGLAEGCVADLLRGRGVTEDGAQMESIQKLLENPLEVRVEGEGDDTREVESGGEVITLEQARTKNKCNAKAIGAPSPARHSPHCHVLGSAQRDVYIPMAWTPHIQPRIVLAQHLTLQGNMGATRDNLAALQIQLTFATFSTI